MLTSSVTPSEPSARESLHSIELRFEDYVVRATSAEAEDLDWVAAVLEGGFEVATGSSTPDAEVALTVDPDRYDALLASDRVEEHLVEGFARDAHPAMFVRWRREESESIVRDPHTSAFYRLRRSPRSVEILLRAMSYDGRMALMQTVRELAMDRIVATGGVLVHGATACVGENALVVAGLKGSGKTTVLLSLLEHGGLSYVSNDRCVLRVGEVDATVRGLPTIVSITRGSLDAFPEFRGRLYDARPDLATSESAAVGLGPQQFARLFPVPRTSHARVAAFVFPHVTGGQSRMALHRLNRAESIEHFGSGLFRAGHASVLGDVFAFDTAPGFSPAGMGESAAHWIAANVPCVRAELGGDGPPNAEDCRALLAQIGVERV